MMNMTTMIKAPVYTPKASIFWYNRPSLMNVSVQIPFCLQQHPVGPFKLSSAVFPIPNKIPYRLQQHCVSPLRLSAAVLPIPNKQHVATHASFQCRYAKDKTTAETKPVNDSRLWNHAPNWLIHAFIWIFFFWSIWLLPKWVFMVWLSVLIVKYLRVSKKTEPDNVTFDDLVGVERPKDIFQKIVHMRQGKLKFGKYERRLACPILLYGPPGTGKSTLVHALAREAKVPFFSVSAYEFAKAEVGLNKINFSFIEARAYPRSIIYIKDVDVIARHERTLVELHREMKKCCKNGKVLVILSTNRPEIRDLGFMRSSHLKIHVGKPNTDSRRTFIGLHLNKFLREEDKEAICNLVASQTPGFVWTDLKRIAKISLRLAAARGDDHVKMDDVLQALGMVKAGYML